MAIGLHTGKLITVYYTMQLAKLLYRLSPSSCNEIKQSGSTSNGVYWVQGMQVWMWWSIWYQLVNMNYQNTLTCVLWLKPHCKHCSDIFASSDVIANPNKNKISTIQWSKIVPLYLYDTVGSANIDMCIQSVVWWCLMLFNRFIVTWQNWMEEDGH